MMKRPYAWEKSYPDDLKWDSPISHSSLGEFVESAVHKWGDAPAMRSRETSLSFNEISEHIRRFAASLKANKVKDTVALFLPNTLYHPICFLGAAYAGVRLTHMSPMDSERVLLHKIKDSGAKIIVTVNFPQMLPIALKFLEMGVINQVIVGEEEIWGKLPFQCPPVTEIKGVTSYKNYVKNHAPLDFPPRVDPETCALIQYTGGTTGLPKGAMLSHKNLTAAVSSYQVWFLGNNMSAEGDDKVIGVLPLFHIYALTSIMLRNFQAGNEVLLHLKFDVEAVLNDIENNGATSFPGVPTMWIALASHPNIENRNFSGLRYAASGGAPMPIEVANKVADITKVHMGGGWGMTETAPSGTNIPRHIEKKGTIGLPLPGIIMGVVALDDNNSFVGANVTGEIVIKSKNTFSGYLNQAEATKRAFNKQGFFLTGDIGYMDEDGFFFLVDRKNDMIISGGFNVYPQMIEQVIYEHPSVFEVIVLGVKDEYRGEAAKAYITLKPNSTLDHNEFMAFLKPRLGKHEMIAGYEIRETLPRTPVGKLSRAELRKEIT